jgi:lysozyme family protein
MVYSFEQTKAGYAKLWSGATLLPAHAAGAAALAQHAIKNKAIYEEIEKDSLVPWWWIAGAHYREADFNLGCYLGNGQTLKKPTTEVPAGHGPFFGSTAFHDGAIDALKHEGMYRLNVEWTVELALYWWERFNGQGYFSHGNSPYVWSWTNLYSGGKFIADHVYSATAMDPQAGCAAILLALAKLDKTVVLAREGQPAPAQPNPTQTQEPPMTVPPAPASPAPVPAVPDFITQFLQGRLQPTDLSTFLGMLQGHLATVAAAPATGAAPATSASGLPLVSIEGVVQGVESVLPIVAQFYPPLSAVLPLLPVINGLLSMLQELQTAGNNPAALVAVIQKHLANIGTDLNSVKSLFPPAAPPAA